jgi:hypothetical protein
LIFADPALVFTLSHRAISICKRILLSIGE